MLSIQLMLMLSAASVLCQGDSVIFPTDIEATEGENATFICRPFIPQARPILLTTDPGSTIARTVEILTDPRVDFIDYDSNRTFIWLDVNRTEDHLRRFQCDINSVRTEFATLRVNFSPGPPTALMVVERTTTSLLIQWENPASDGVSPIASFRLRYLNERTSVTNEVTFSGDTFTTQYNITDLSPSTNYFIELYVRNEVNLEGEPGTVRGTTMSLSEPFRYSGLEIDNRGGCYPEDTAHTRYEIRADVHSIITEELEGRYGADSGGGSGSGSTGAPSPTSITVTSSTSSTTYNPTASPTSGNT